MLFLLALLLLRFIFHLLQRIDHLPENPLTTTTVIAKNKHGNESKRMNWDTSRDGKIQPPIPSDQAFSGRW
jgi:hypothetical protein